MNWKQKFRKKFCVKDKQAVEGYALLLLEATIPNLENFIQSTLREELRGILASIRDLPSYRASGVSQIKEDITALLQERIKELK